MHVLSLARARAGLLAALSLSLVACSSSPASNSGAALCNTGELEWPEAAEPLWNNFEVTSVNREAARASFVPMSVPTELEPGEEPEA